jgi:hypothetical protein
MITIIYIICPALAESHRTTGYSGQALWSWQTKEARIDLWTQGFAFLHSGSLQRDVWDITLLEDPHINGGKENKSFSWERKLREPFMISEGFILPNPHLVQRTYSKHFKIGCFSKYTILVRWDVAEFRVSEGAEAPYPISLWSWEGPRRRLAYSFNH